MPMNASAHLRANKEKILRRWEEISLANLPEAQALSRTAIRDHVPQVFNALCDVLDTGVFKRPDALSKIHGRQRSWSTDYSLAEVMAEYAILKNLIFDELEVFGASIKCFRLTDFFFDSASSIATSEFVGLREDQLNNVTKSLISINQELETFAAVAAHDLRSPTSTILGYVDLIASEEPIAAEVAGKAVETIKRTAGRMLELIDRLLEYSRIGKEHLARENFSLKAAAMDAADLLSTQIQDSGTLVHVGDLPDYMGDQILFRQLFQNLISNSIKFRSQKRACEIFVRATKDDAHLRLVVTDNGSGFDPVLSEQIFQPFKRGTNRLDIQGSGLGLATVKKIVELHGGKIHGKGALDIGAEIQIELPVNP